MGVHYHNMEYIETDKDFLSELITGKILDKLIHQNLAINGVIV